jgi:hypothetical protein
VLEVGLLSVEALGFEKNLSPTGHFGEGVDGLGKSTSGFFDVMEGGIEMPGGGEFLSGGGVGFVLAFDKLLKPLIQKGVSFRVIEEEKGLGGEEIEESGKRKIFLEGLLNEGLFGCWEEDDGFEVRLVSGSSEAALSRGIEFADGFDFVAKEVDTEGVFGIEGKYVEDAAADSEFAPSFNGGCATVSEGFGSIGKLVGVEKITEGNGKHLLANEVEGRDTMEKSLDGDDADGRLGAGRRLYGEVFEELEMTDLFFKGGRILFVGKDLAFDPVEGGRSGEKRDIVGEFAGSFVVGGDDSNERPSEVGRVGVLGVGEGGDEGSEGTGP